MVSFLQVFLPKHFPFSHVRYLPCPSQFPSFHHSKTLDEEYKLLNFSLCTLLQPPTTLSVYILLSIHLNILIFFLSYRNILNNCESNRKLQLKTKYTFHVIMLLATSLYTILWRQLQDSKTLRQCFYCKLLTSNETFKGLAWHRIKEI